MSKQSVTVRFNRFPQTAIATKDAVRKVVEKATFDTQARAVDKAPYDTGFLQESISSHVEGTFTGAEGIVYTNTEYAPWQEFGTVHNAPHPFMRPAAAETAADLRNLARTIGPAVEKAARGG